jgi:hypothetical protein
MSRKQWNWNVDMLSSQYVVFESQVANVDQGIIEQQAGEDNELYVGADNDDDEPLNTVAPDSLESQYLINYALFLLKLQSDDCLPVSTVQAIADEISLLHDVENQHIVAQIEPNANKSTKGIKGQAEKSEE